MAESPPEEVRRSGDERFKGLGDAASRVVREAASVLEEELAGGIAEARRLQDRLIQDRRVDPEAFRSTMDRLRRDGHELIDLAADRVADFRADDVQDLARRFTRDAHDVLDSVIALVDQAPDIVNGLAERMRTRSRPVEEIAEPPVPPE
jgi:hypothetical protein